MVLNHLIYPCDHELWYSLSLHIVLSRKHFTLWLDSINTSPELFTGHGDGTAFKQTSFPWALYSFRSLLQLLLTIASGLLEGDSPLTWKPWCLQLQVSGNLQITSSLIIFILHSPEQLLQCRADSTIPETMCAQSYVSSYSGKKNYQPLQ